MSPQFVRTFSERGMRAELYRQILYGEPRRGGQTAAAHLLRQAAKRGPGGGKGVNRDLSNCGRLSDLKGRRP